MRYLRKLLGDVHKIKPWSQEPNFALDPTPHSMCGLVKAFFEKDPYDSRPIPTDQLYISFKTGYLNACDPEDRIFATAFLTTIETEQATRSTSNG